MALRELRAGRKTSHWIWYVFPQLAGLGRSPYAVHYGLGGVDEAADYLRDPVLGARLVEAAAAKTLDAMNPQPRFAAMAAHADAILAAAAAQGYDRCAYTLEHL